MAKYNPFKENIPLATLMRLPSYLAIVEDSSAEGNSHISSSELSERIGITGGQVRKDLDYVGVSGKPRTGFNLQEIAQKIKYILGFDENRYAIIVGNNNFYEALLNENNLVNKKLYIQAIFVSDFDLKAEKINQSKNNNIEVYRYEDMREYCASTAIDFAILDVEPKQANYYANLIISCGIKAIWNFTNTKLDIPGNIIVQSAGIEESLGLLWYKLHRSANDQDLSL